ncbi:hypothetical protein QQS21_003109 [Conoideocrella luteorostrata]|uniref:Xaa-Pro dipeptidyl-peptidase C-terminal domain-containing protein n=1 Tax=Conoideocrella luteorostrata TaxID=1105319 RepID=A0AAJ0CXU9_9HYPO|nr:hypothetical protein QQS21_003109 [Conoideocrella luteorostrata]
MSQPSPRSFLGWILDYLAAWIFNLPPEKCSYTVQTVRIPVAPSVELLAQLYQPTNLNPSSTILSVGPYGRSSIMGLGSVRLFASRGYQGLLVSVRGTFGSGGTFDPGLHTTDDAKAIVSWMQKQSWYTGRFAMFGASYLGLTQWATLENQPPDMAASVILVGPHDLSQYIWSTGALNLDLLLWAGLIARQEGCSMLWAQLQMQFATSRLSHQLFRAVPLADAADKYFSGKTPWLRRRIETPDLNDAFWKPMQHLKAVERADLPILMVSGWQDVFLPQTMEQYHVLQKRGVDVALTIGPWHHATVQNGTTFSETFQWLEQKVAKKQGAERTSPVRYYVSGAKEWRNAATWPPLTASKDLYLHPTKLSETKPPARATESTFVFDPENPTPALGGPRLAHSNVFIDTALAERDDVLTFTTDPLSHDTEVLGPCVVELIHSSDGPADLFVRISDVDERHVSRYVTETYQRLTTMTTTGKRDGETIRLSLPDCAHRFKKGHAIRLVVAGGNYPHYTPNSGVVSGDVNDATKRLVTHVVRHAADQLSKLTISVAN